MKDNQFYTQRFHAAKILLFVTFIAGSVALTFGQSNVKSVSAADIIKRIEAGASVNYENAMVKDDLDLSKLTGRTNDATYPEQGKTARVFSAIIKQPVTFKNVVFAGKVSFFRKEITANEINEYRLVFSDQVKFENCRFEGAADFQLTNFDGEVSFENSVFLLKPSFIRVGLAKTPIFTGTKFKEGSIFQNFQNDAPQNFSAEELQNFYEQYLASGK